MQNCTLPSYAEVWAFICAWECKRSETIKFDQSPLLVLRFSLLLVDLGRTVQRNGVFTIYSAYILYLD